MDSSTSGLDGVLGNRFTFLSEGTEKIRKEKNIGNNNFGY
jgi:hypothetical protein